MLMGQHGDALCPMSSKKSSCQNTKAGGWDWLLGDAKASETEKMPTSAVFAAEAAVNVRAKFNQAEPARSPGRIRQLLAPLGSLCCHILSSMSLSWPGSSSQKGWWGIYLFWHCTHDRDLRMQKCLEGSVGIIYNLHCLSCWKGFWVTSPHRHTLQNTM